MLRVSIHSDLGRNLGQRYGARVSPTFIIFDSTGQEIWRGSVLPSTAQVLAGAP